nr:reverse transcriptase domain-containing protein [Tanacetum cinerariifolium]
MMAKLCQPSINGRGGPIAPIPIQATDFGLHHHMIQQVQNTCQFHRLPGDDANRHIDKFLEITQHMKQNGVFDDALCLSIFPYSLTHHVIAWFYNGLTLSHWDTINAAAGGTFMQKTLKECYELIENMTAHHNHWDTLAIQDETSRDISFTSTTETVDGYTKESAYATTGNYNSGVNSYQPQGDRNLLSYRSNNYLGPPGFNQPNVQNRFNQNQNQSYTQNQGNNRENYQNRGSNFNQRNNQNQVFNQNQGRGNNFNQAPTYQAPTHQLQVVPQVSESQAYMKANDVVMKNMQTQMTSLTNSNLELKNMFGQFMKMNTVSSSGTGSLPSNTVPNPREDLKAITTRSGVTLARPSVSSSSSKEVDREPETITDQMPEVTKDTVPPSTKNIQPLMAQTQILIYEPVVTPKPKPSIPYPLRVNKQTLREKDDNLALKFVEIFRNLHFELSFADALLHMPKFALMFKSLINNKEKLFDLSTTLVNENCSTVILKKLPEKLGDPGKFLIPCDFLEFDECLALADLGTSINLMPLSIWKKLSLPELTSTQMILELADQSTTRPTSIAKDETLLRTGRALIDVYGEELTIRVDDEAITIKEYVQEVLGFSDNSKSGNPTPISDPIIALSSPSLTPFEGGDFILEEIEACLTSESIPPGIDDTDLDLEGDIRILKELLNYDPSLSPLPPKELNVEEIKTVKSSIDEPP